MIMLTIFVVWIQFGFWTSLPINALPANGAVVAETLQSNRPVTTPQQTDTVQYAQHQYAQELGEAAAILQQVLDDACCDASGELDDEQLAQAYQNAYEISVAAMAPNDEINDAIALWPLLKPEVNRLLQEGDEVQNLEDEVRTGLARIQVTVEQIDRVAKDRVDERISILTQIFERPEFQDQLTLWQRFVRWLDQLLAQYWPQSSGRSEGSTFLGQLVAWALTIVGAIAITLLLSYWLQQLFGGFTKNANISTRKSADESLLTAQEARAQAAEQAQSGNYRGAVRRLYLAALLTMEEQGAIRYDRSQTNREVLAQVKSDEALASHLRPVVETFDDVWYGIQEPDHNIYQDYTNEVDRLTQTALEHSVAEHSSQRTDHQPPKPNGEHR